MSKEQFEAMEAVIKVIPPAETKTPNMPVNTYLQEAADLKVWSTDDRTVLEGAGLNPVFLDELDARIGALRYAQSLWNKEWNSQEEAGKTWSREEPVARELKDELEHTFRYAFRARPDLLDKVKLIEQGTGHADLVQDLSDLSVLGSANLPLLQAINFEETKLATAAEESGQMSELLATMNGERTSGNKGKVVRDQAYTHLKQAVDEIYAAGKFAFWKDEVRLKGYSSTYRRKWK